MERKFKYYNSESDSCMRSRIILSISEQFLSFRLLFSACHLSPREQRWPWRATSKKSMSESLTLH